MNKDWRAYAKHILECADKLQAITRRGDISTDVVLYDAALRNLQTLSEATQKLPNEMKTSHPEIEWQKISAFRNIIVHNYLGDIDAVTVMQVIATQVEPLRDVVRHMLKSED